MSPSSVDLLIPLMLKQFWRQFLNKEWKTHNFMPNKTYFHAGNIIKTSMKICQFRKIAKLQGKVSVSL